MDNFHVVQDRVEHLIFLEDDLTLNFFDFEVQMSLFGVLLFDLSGLKRQFLQSRQLFPFPHLRHDFLIRFFWFLFFLLSLHLLLSLLLRKEPSKQIRLIILFKLSPILHILHIHLFKPLLKFLLAHYILSILQKPTRLLRNHQLLTFSLEMSIERQIDFLLQDSFQNGILEIFGDFQRVCRD